ncbi:MULTISPECIES: anhydro-N-acetylmuramic acid kinase [unclassified Prochlorococcus]|uniref:anhydro-N-acetylmuramic acid kinase n=1 Tax=unclassified Prochlorococcus TaxID=2627481 RepID=UPI0005338D21|nr:MULTISPECIES: anhydro-N-acetylmuramic acid kinase [unclassified Prochlorococcus]KGG16856.1 Anhydro-N-acetylmuramic acid kinase [Prochlorococcus sp. MIT 0602]KGG18170.1 Anhydro-N-acetylmuramic acid kinase [Prochlorococcus sp. MIT 0603]
MYVLGLMSGTSADGVDAALVEFKGRYDKPKWKLINSTSVEYPKKLQEKVVAAGQGVQFSAAEWLELSESITEVYYSAATICDPQGIANAIGCHGQTVFHRPPNISSKGASCQILQAPLLATLLERTVIYDFRAKDLALGGQGAPLTPFLDSALLDKGNGWRGVLNLGGIANLTLIPPSVGPDRNCEVLGWDCGPANTLIDLAVQKITNGQLKYDCDGLIALEGHPDFAVIDQWLKEDFFQALPPKSTGREYFGTQDLERRLEEINSDNNNDWIATLTSFSASVISQDIQNLNHRYSIRPIELLLAGGGSKNPFLVNEIRRRCRGIRISYMDDIGVPVQIREAIAFALLAWWNICQKPCSNLITGAERPVVLGSSVSP